MNTKTGKERAVYLAPDIKIYTILPQRILDGSQTESVGNSDHNYGDDAFSQ